MRVIGGITIVVTALFICVPAFTDTTRIDYKDPARAAKGLALLYRDIGKSAVDFFKDIFMSSSSGDTSRKAAVISAACFLRP